MEKTLESETARLQTFGVSKECAKDWAAAVLEFEAFRDRGLARIRVVEDENAYEHEGTSSALQRMMTLRRIEREGLWAIRGEIKCPNCDDWHGTEAFGGFVGDDWRGSSDEASIMRSATLRLKKEFQDQEQGRVTTPNLIATTLLAISSITSQLQALGAAEPKVLLEVGKRIQSLIYNPVNPAPHDMVCRAVAQLLEGLAVRRDPSVARNVDQTAN